MDFIRGFFTSPAGIICLLALLLVIVVIVIVEISSRRKRSGNQGSVIIAEAPEQWVQPVAAEQSKFKQYYVHTSEPVLVNVLECTEAQGRRLAPGDLPVYVVRLRGYPNTFLARQDPVHQVFIATLLEAKETGEQIPVIMQNDWIYVW